MKEESVLNVLMYLFQNHMQENCELTQDPSHIIHALEEAGFNSSAINEAINWLEALVKKDAKLLEKPQSTSTRVFTAFEHDIIDEESLGFILSLELQGILTPETREVVINQILALETETVDVSLVKWVTLMVLFNQPGNKKELASMEFFVLDSAVSGVH